MSAVTRTRTTRRTTVPRDRKPPVARYFKEWLGDRDRVKQLNERVDVLHDRILKVVFQHGRADDRGSFELDLAEPIEFTDHEGVTHKYSMLKAEKHLLPARRLPVAEKAIKLLTRRHLWLSAEDKETINAIMVDCPFAKITVSLDVEAFAAAVFKDQITDAEYQATLQEQRESFQFRQGEL